MYDSQSDGVGVRPEGGSCPLSEGEGVRVTPYDLELVAALTAERRHHSEKLSSKGVFVGRKVALQKVFVGSPC